MADDIPARFRKTKNETWAVMAPVSTLEKALAEGGKVDVQKRSGDWTTFTVASLGRPFDVDGVAMCYGYPASEGEEGAPTAQGSRSAKPQAAAKAAPSQSKPVDYAAAAPQPDPTEPLPEYRGDPGEDWG